MYLAIKSVRAGEDISSAVYMRKWRMRAIGMAASISLADSNREMAVGVHGAMQLVE